MRKFVRYLSAKSGMPPATLTHVGEVPAEACVATLTAYDEQAFTQREVAIDEIAGIEATDAVTWLHVNGVHDMKLLAAIGAHFGLHPLVLEDIANSQERPDIEDYEGYTFISLKSMRFDGEAKGIFARHIGIVFSSEWVLSFQESGPDEFAAVRERLRNNTGRGRQAKSDYLVYALLDTIVDCYYVALDALADVIEDLQDALVAAGPDGQLSQILRLKSEVRFFRRTLWPLREMVAALERGIPGIFHEQTRTYLNDLYDHVILAVDTIEIFREVMSDLIDTYMSVTSNRMNQIMQVLTIIATIFIPLTFIAGVYGMNFRYMPGLTSPWGYPVIIAIMMATALAMLAFFRRKNWL